MCEPTTALMLASTAFGLYQTREQAKDQQRFYRQAAADEADQAFQSQSAQADQTARRARQERARLRALSAESGLSGISIDETLDNVDMQAAMDMGMIDLNLENSRTASRNSLQSNMNMIRQPDYIGSALNAGLAIANYRSTRNDPNGG